MEWNGALATIRRASTKDGGTKLAPLGRQGSEATGKLTTRAVNTRFLRIEGDKSILDGVMTKHARKKCGRGGKAIAIEKKKSLA